MSRKDHPVALCHGRLTRLTFSNVYRMENGRPVQGQLQGHTQREWLEEGIRVQLSSIRQTHSLKLSLSKAFP